MTAWGRIIVTTGSLANTVGANQPFRYRGYVYDEETGWYYLQSRYYDPTTCRFISTDVLLSTGQGVIGHNSFAYCLNNPVIRVDVDGGLGLLIGGLIAIGVAVVSGLITGGFEAAQGGSFGEGFVVGFTGTIVAEALTAVSIATFGATTAPAIMACSAVSAGFGSVASYGVNCAFKEETFDFGDAAMSFGIGAAVNVVGGGCMGAFINSATNSVIENVILSGVSSLASDCIGEGFDLLEKSISYRKERELAKKTRERAKQRRLSRMNRKMRRVRHAKFTRCNIAPHAFFQMRPYNQIF